MPWGPQSALEVEAPRFAARQVLKPILFIALLLAGVACQKSPQGTPGGASDRFLPSPARDLSFDEEEGGHTLGKHVGRTDLQLRERLRDEPDISAASTYLDRATAEKVAGTVLLEQHDRVERWVERSGGHPNLVLDYEGDAAHPIGRTLRRGADRVEPCSHAVVVLRWAGGGEYYVLTSYPECR